MIEAACTSWDPELGKKDTAQAICLVLAYCLPTNLHLLKDRLHDSEQLVHEFLNKR